MKTLYIKQSFIKWSSIQITGTPYPLGGMDGSTGFLLVYESLEEFERNNPGEEPFIVSSKSIANTDQTIK